SGAASQAFDDPGAAHPEDWGLYDRRPDEWYAPTYADRFARLEGQWAAFRRGDSCTFVAAFDASRDPTLGHQAARAALVLARNERSLVVSPPARPAAPPASRSASAVTYAPSGRSPASPLPANPSPRRSASRPRAAPGWGAPLSPSGWSDAAVRWSCNGTRCCGPKAASRPACSASISPGSPPAATA